jgi:peptide/nickel transport system substrate-binding protein
VTRAIGVGNAPGSLAVSEDSVWVVNSLDDTVMRINPDMNSIVGTTEVEDGPSGIAIVQEIVWVANEADGTLSRIEPGQTSASRTDIGSVPEGLADVNGDLWVSVHGTSASHRGGTLRIVSLQRKEVATLDSRVAYTVGSSRILHLIGDGLVAFKPADTTPVPDLATSLPTPTDGGRIYTFELRPEMLYSSGETVEPGDFRRGLEQGFRLNVGLYKSFYGGLVGGAACGKEPETCDLRDGVVTDEASGMIAFHLTAPDPEFLFKLTLPFAYPVPPSVPDEEQPAAGVPGTGPYMLEAPMTGDGLTLIRNPRFRVWSPSAQPDGYVDQMEWSFGVEPQAQIDAVTTGEADLMFEAVASGRLDEILVRNAAQVHTSPLARTVFNVLDITVPPFDNLQVRQALNFAVDRERVVQAFEGAALPTCQQIPPNFPGYEPYCPYTIDPGPEGEGSWTGPDMRRAHGLIHRSGTTDMRVMFQYADKSYGAGWRPPGDYMVELLRELGYRVSVWSPSADLGNQPQMYLGGWSADYPAASNFIANIFSCDATVFSEGFCDPQIDRMIDHALDVQADDPVAAGALWAEVDRKIVDQAPFLWLVTAIDVDFVSERVGNYQSSLQYGVLLNQLWVR